MKLAYQEFGEGKPIIVLHGVFGSSDNWLSIAKELSGYKLYLLDLRNHGDSPHSDVHTYEAMSGDIKEFIEDYELVDPIVMGHSMGGKVAMRFALDHPEMLEKLIVVDIAPGYYKRHHDKILEGLNSIDPGEIKSRKEADEKLAQYEPSLGVRQFLLKNLGRKDNGFYWKINLSVLTKDNDQVGEAINGSSFIKPTLFIKGSKSDYIQDKDEALIKKMFPESRVEAIPEAGHWVHAESPQAFLESPLENLFKEIF